MRWISSIDWKSDLNETVVDLTDSDEYQLVQKDELFGKLFETKAFSDLTFEIDGRELKAHKCVLSSKLLWKLSSRSPVFEVMFSNDMKESREDQLIIQDIEYDTFHELLRFLYCRKLMNLKMVWASWKTLWPLKIAWMFWSLLIEIFPRIWRLRWRDSLKGEFFEALLIISRISIKNLLFPDTLKFWLSLPTLGIQHWPVQSDANFVDPAGNSRMKFLFLSKFNFFSRFFCLI